MKTEDIIEETATLCAAEHVAQGWDVAEGGYDLGVYSGDWQALRDALKRAPTCAETREFELAMKKILH